MKRAVSLGVTVSFLAFSVGASAEEPDSKIRRDDAGVTGVSPFWEVLKKGDHAFIAGDYDEAKTHFENAIKREPQNALAHARVAQTLLAKGELDAALERLESALGFANQLDMRGKILFLQADIRERQVKLDQAKLAWQKYQSLANSKAAVDGQVKNLHPETAAERLQQLQQAKERTVAYAAVKERIEKREKELDDTARGKN